MWSCLRLSTQTYPAIVHPSEKILPCSCARRDHEDFLFGKGTTDGVLVVQVIVPVVVNVEAVLYITTNASARVCRSSGSGPKNSVDERLGHASARMCFLCTVVVGSLWSSFSSLAASFSHGSSASGKFYERRHVPKVVSWATTCPDLPQKIASPNQQESFPKFIFVSHPEKKNLVAPPNWPAAYSSSISGGSTATIAGLFAHSLSRQAAHNNHGVALLLDVVLRH